MRGAGLAEFITAVGVRALWRAEWPMVLMVMAIGRAAALGHAEYNKNSQRRG